MTSEEGELNPPKGMIGKKDEEMVNLAKHSDLESFRKVYNDEF